MSMNNKQTYDKTVNNKQLYNMTMNNKQTYDKTVNNKQTYDFTVNYKQKSLRLQGVSLARPPLGVISRTIDDITPCS